jgi:uncharacterized protein (TIGR02145 family)/uncharacterized repeat protein (TIGR02543 family)
MSSADIKLFAQWAVDSLTVSFNTKGGSSVASQDVVYGSSATAPSTPPTRTGFNFGGWFKEDACTTPWNFTTEIITTDATIYAKWVVITCIVSFDSKGGSTMAPQTVDYGSFATTPSPVPNRLGYTFGGWYKEDACTTPWNFTVNSITANVTIYAKWTVITNTVVFNTQGGSAVASQEVNYGGTVTQPSTSPTRTGYTFNGWYNDAVGTSPWNFMLQTITAPDTVYAGWMINSYTVYFNSQGGTGTPSQTINYGSNLTKPTPPAKTSYVFRGWYNESAGTTAWNFANDAVYSNDTLYAKWAIMDADSNVYTEVKIGTQVWMVENLKTTKLNDGTLIPLVTDSVAWADGGLQLEAYCWYDNNSANKIPYGALYTWNVVYTGKLAPKGWHVPYSNEWDTLIALLGGSDVAGGKMKETGTTHWNSPNIGGTNSSGFMAVPGGMRTASALGGKPGIFGLIGTYTAWWVNFDLDQEFQTESVITNDQTNIDYYTLLKNGGRSIRCVRDW